MQKYVKVASASTSGLVKHNAKPSTSERILQLRKALGLNLREESVLEGIRRDFRALNNQNLTLNY